MGVAVPVWVGVEVVVAVGVVVAVLVAVVDGVVVAVAVGVVVGVAVGKGFVNVQLILNAESMETSATIAVALMLLLPLTSTLETLLVPDGSILHRVVADGRKLRSCDVAP